MRCPNCLGTGKVPQVIRLKYGVKVVDLQGTLPQLTCMVCHGTGERPAWMDDPRHAGHREEGFDYAGNQ